jgi:integrase
MRSLQITRLCLERAIGTPEIRDLVGRNVAALVKAAAGRAGRPSKLLTLEQAQELLRAAGGSRLYTYVALSVTTGLRTEELRALRWNEVDLDAGTVAVNRAVRTTATRRRRRADGSCRCRNWPYGRSVSISTARPGDRLLAGVSAVGRW